MPDDPRTDGDGYHRDWTPQGSEQPSAPRDYERNSVARPKIVLGVAAGLIVVIAIVHFALAGLLADFQSRPAQADRRMLPRWYLARLAAGLTPPAPRLQTAPEDDLNALRFQETAILSTYGWIDRNHGVVRIPIARAKALLIARGIPHAPGPPAAARSDALARAPFPNDGVLLGGETPEQGGNRADAH